MTAIELNVTFLLASMGILFFILRYRVHFHIEYRPRGRRVRRAANPRLVVPGKRKAGEISGEVPPQVLRDLESALKNLGATTKEARQRAAAAVAQGTGDFDSLLMRALQAGKPR